MAKLDEVCYRHALKDETYRLALLRAYQRDAKDYALYAKRAQTDRMKRYWLHAEATVLRQIERLEKKDAK